MPILQYNDIEASMYGLDIGKDRIFTDLKLLLKDCCMFSAKDRPSALEIGRKLRCIQSRLIESGCDTESRYDSNRKRRQRHITTSKHDNTAPDGQQCCACKNTECSYYCYYGGCRKPMCSPEKGCSYVVQFTDERTAWLCGTCWSFIRQDFSTQNITKVDGKPNYYKSNLLYSTVF